MNFFNPQPKCPAIKLSDRDRHELKMDLYFNRADRCCETCAEKDPPVYKYLPLYGTVFQIAHLSHIAPRNRGGDVPENCLIECYQCHINERHGLKWSKDEAN